MYLHLYCHCKNNDAVWLKDLDPPRVFHDKFQNFDLVSLLCYILSSYTTDTVLPWKSVRIWRNFKKIPYLLRDQLNSVELYVLFCQIIKNTSNWLNHSRPMHLWKLHWTKIKLNFHFHTSLWCLKRFYEGL